MRSTLNMRPSNEDIRSSSVFALPMPVSSSSPIESPFMVNLYFDFYYLLFIYLCMKLNLRYKKSPVLGGFLSSVSAVYSGRRGEIKEIISRYLPIRSSVNTQHGLAIRWLACSINPTVYVLNRFPYSKSKLGLR